MPPRKKQRTAAPAKPRRSKLAKDNNITSEQEAEIREAWYLFRHDDVTEFENEKEGVIKTNDVPHALKALGIAPKSTAELDEYIEILDPDSEGYVTFSHFIELSALQINNKSDETREEEVSTAFKLFTKGSDGPIGVKDLRLVAKTLKEDLSDDVLKAMIIEANGGEGVTKGVDMEDFRSVMTRAGVFQ